MLTYVFWFIAALALLVIELASTTFFAIFLAAGAFAGGLVAFLVPDSPIWIQGLLAIAVAGLGVVVIRPVLARRLQGPGPGAISPGVHGGFVGQRALAMDAIGDELHPGHVRLAGETWLAFTDAPDQIAEQSPVIIAAVRGTTLMVRPAD